MNAARGVVQTTNKHGKGRDHEEERPPPQSVQAEQAVCGGLMIDPLAWEQVAEVVRPEDFYRPDHKLIFATIAKLARAGKAHDPVLVFAELGEDASQAGGFAYLSDIARNTP